MNYHNKIFRPISNSTNGETSEQTVFHYKQTGQILTAEYAGGQIQKGHLIGLVDELGNIDMRYHQVNNKGELMTGTCQSTPKILPNGKCDFTKNGSGHPEIHLKVHQLLRNNNYKMLR